MNYQSKWKTSKGYVNLFLSFMLGKCRFCVSKNINISFSYYYFRQFMRFTKVSSTWSRRQRFLRLRSGPSTCCTATGWPNDYIAALEFSATSDRFHGISVVCIPAGIGVPPQVPTVCPSTCTGASVCTAACACALTDASVNTDISCVLTGANACSGTCVFTYVLPGTADWSILTNTVPVWRCYVFTRIGFPQVSTYVIRLLPIIYLIPMYNFCKFNCMKQ